MSTPTYLEVNISQIQNLDISGNTTISGNTSIRGNTTISGAVRADSSFNVVSDTSLSRIQIQNTANSQYIHMSLSGLSFTGTLSPQSSTIFNGVANSVSYSISQAELSYLSGVNKSIQQQFADMSANTQTALNLRAPLANPTFTGTVSGITKSMVGLGSVDNTADVDKPISTATQTALNTKAPIDSPTFTGTISGITKSMVGLGNVDNTSDANKPVSTATQTALNAKANDNAVVHLAGAETITGDKTFIGNVIASSRLITPTQLSYLADMSLSLLTAFNTRPVYSQLLATANTWTGVNTFNTNHVAVTKSIGMAGAAPDTDGSLYFSTTLTNRKIVLYKGFNNEFQNYSIGVQGSTMQFVVFTTQDGFTFSGGASSTSKTDFARIDINGVNIFTGTILLNGTDLFARNNTWTGTNTFNTNNVAVSKSIGIGGATVQADGGVYFPTTATNRKIVLYPVANNEFQNMSIGSTASSMQFMVDNTGDSYVFSAATSSTAKTDYATLNNSGLSVANSIGIAGATIQATNGIYFPNGDNNRMIVLYNGNVATPNAFQNHSIGKGSFTMQFLVDNTQNRYTFSAATSTTAKTDFALIGNTGVDIKMGSLLIAGTDIFARNNTWSGINTFTANITANAKTVTPTQLGYLSDLSMTLLDAFNVRPVYSQLLAATQTWSGINTFTGNVVANAKTVTPTQLGYLSDLSLSLLDAFNTRPVYSQLLGSTHTWTGLNTFSTNNVAVSKSVGLGGATVDADGGIYFPSTITNRKLVLYRMSNNEFQNYSIGIQSGTIQFMVDQNTAGYTFSTATSSTTKSDYVRIDNGGVNIFAGTLKLNNTDIFARTNTWSGTNTFSSAPTMSSGLNVTGNILADGMRISSSATIQATGGIYFPATDLNRKIVLYPVTAGECGNHSIGVANSGSTTQFMVPNNTSNYVFSFGTGAATKTDIATLSSTGINIQSGSLSIGGSAYDTNLVHLTGAETIGGDKTFTGTVSGITATMVGLGNVNNTADADKPISTATQTALDAKAPLANPTFTGTVSGITASMVGLGNVDNTSDANKPISTATQAALDAKAPLASPTFTGTVSGITAAMVGLGNVDNTSDANKPISTATQTALNLRAFDASCVHLTGAETIAGAKTFSGAASFNGGINASSISMTGNISAVNALMMGAAPFQTNGALHFPASDLNRKIILYPVGNNAYQSYSIGANNTNLEQIYMVPDNTRSHKFSYGTSSTSKADILTLKADTSTFFSDVVLNGLLQCGTIRSDWLDASLNIRAYDASCVHITGNETISGNKTFTGTISGITATMVGLGNVDNTSDLNKPVSIATQSALDAKAPLANPVFSGTVSGITKAMVGLGNVDNTADVDKPISTATQTAINAKANISGPNFSGTVGLNQIRFTGGTIQSSGGIYYSSTDLNRKIVLAPGSTSGECGNHSIGTGSGGNVFQFMVPDTNRSYVFSFGTGASTKTDIATISSAGINVQSGNFLINGTAYDSNLVHLTGTETIAGDKTFTGTIAGITKTMVGLGNVDNTSDANKPVSTATQTALDAKANDNAVVHLAGAETISGDKTITGNLITNAKTVSPAQLGYLSDFTTSSIKEYVDSNSGTGLLSSNNTWSGINTFGTNNLFVYKSLGIGNTTVQDNSGIYFSPEGSNRKLVLYPVTNNEFQNMSIGANATNMQFMVNDTTRKYTFSAATGAATKTDYVTLDNTALNVSNSIGIGGATVNTTGGIYFPNTVTNRKLVLYSMANNEFQNFSIGFNNTMTMQFLVGNSTSQYLFSHGTVSPGKTDWARIDSTGIDVLNGNLKIGGTSIFARANTWTTTNTFSGTINTAGLIGEATNAIGGVANAYTLNYTTGGIYYIPSNIAITANASIVITNIPTDTTKSYTLTVGYYQSNSRFFINQVRVSDTASAYISGTASTFVSPLFNGGTPSFSTSGACLVLQQFTIFSISTTRYVLSSVSSFEA